MNGTAVGVARINLITIGTWNDAAVETAWSQGASQDELPFIVYGASKTESERESWKWMEANKPHFVLNTVLPDMNVSALLAGLVKRH